MEGNFIMNNIFTKDASNRQRQIELDIAKGLAIIFMVWVHVNEYFQADLYHGGTYNRVVEFLGSPPAAPVFMLLLGVGIVFSRNSTPAKLATRGAKLLLGGYILSFIRDVVPYYFLYKREPDQELITEGIALLWGVDILHFAGLVLIFFAVVKKFQITNRTLFIIWCAFTSLHLVVRGITFSSDTANRIFGLFWGTDEYSWFPFLNWITFPMAGYVFGQYLVRCIDKKVFYKTIFIWSTAISVPLWIYSYINNVHFGAFGELWQDTYYHHDIIGSMVLISFALSWISAIYFITPMVPEAVQKVCGRWSRNTNSIYSISYIILGFSLLIIEETSCAPWQGCVLSVIIFILSDVSSILRDKIKQMHWSFSRKNTVEE